MKKDGTLQTRKRKQKPDSNGVLRQCGGGGGGGGDTSKKLTNSHHSRSNRTYGSSQSGKIP